MSHEHGKGDHDEISEAIEAGWGRNVLGVVGKREQSALWDLLGHNATYNRAVATLDANSLWCDGPGARRVRRGCEDGHATSALLTNYTKEGDKFQNFLRVFPLTEDDGTKVSHMLGVLQNVNA